VPGARLPNNLHVTVPGVDGEDLLFLLDAAGVSVSTGSACLAGVARVSPVLLAMGLPVEEARGALRITFGHTSTEEDVDALLAALPALAAVA
jgi:cysteine desulfurase